MENSSPGRSLKEEFRPSKFGLAYPDPDAFVRSQWHQPKWFYFIWRLFWFLWHIGWIIASGVYTRKNQARYPEEGAKWFIYFTNITLLLTTLTCTVDFLIVLYVSALRGGTVLDTTPWYVKLLWLMYNVISSVNIVITVVYWAVGYHAGNTDVISVEAHTINSAFIILNILVTAMPIQILHCIYPMVYAALYFLFNFIYIVAGGTDLQGRTVIYSSVDWNKPFPTAVVVTLGVLLAVPVGHVLVFAIYTLRVFLYSKVNSASYSLRESCLRLTNRTVDVNNPHGNENIEMTNSAAV
ncbi:unnamed protein product [Candidula unifasciata]|uniref:Protein rolling stone n=1 Tax=Candidula unifasciata TaxID=100452 RepID=A0A8S3YY53_9EUPU|nr:unnamed protein product [Candidula unifasciata]